MLKRLILLLAALALVAAACGGDDSGTETTVPGTDTTTAGDTTPGTVGTPAQGGATLATVESRGRLICGVNRVLAGFGFQDDAGNFSGFDVDYCHAIAAAVLGDGDAVDFRALTAEERFPALQTGEIDVLIRNTTWTQTRDVTLGADFGPTTFYDGQGIAALASDGFSGESGVVDIDGSVVCTNKGTTTELNISAAAVVAGITIDLQTFDDFDQVMAAFQAGSCDVITTDKSGLASRKATTTPQEFADDMTIFGVTLSKEPLGPMYRANDSQWADIVDWVVYATFFAEEQGLTQSNIDDTVASSDNENLIAFFGPGDDRGNQAAMGLRPDAFNLVIKAVGNYEEIYLRNLGPDTPFNLPRGVNSQWIDGGLLYAPAAR